MWAFTEQCGADMNDPPPQRFQQDSAFDIPLVLFRVGPMLGAVVLDGDPPFFPAEVGACDNSTGGVSYTNLRLRPRQPIVDEQHPCDAFLRRLGSAVDVVENFAERDESS